jgi:hypothetical protein
MKLNLTVLAAFALLFQMILSPGAAAQQQGEADVAMQAEAEADRLQRTLDLEDWQVFYVDSTLKHDFAAIMAEYAKLQGSKVSNVSLYQSVKDKWMDQIDATYKKIFTEEQWKEYLKTGAGKAIKAREKRKAKAQGGSKK